MKEGLIGQEGRLLLTPRKKESSYQLSIAEENRKNIAEQQDKMSLLKAKGKAVEDQDERVLVRQPR